MNSCQQVENLVNTSIEGGAKLELGGARQDLFYKPTLITGCTSETPIFKNEIFGPVVAVSEFETEEEVLQKANNSNSGLAAYFFTTDVRQMVRVSAGLQYGMVGVNEGLISSAEAPFGGVKESGVGREGSKYGTDAYVNIKYVCLGGI